MSEEGFWDAICHEPCAPVNWGVFADFLEENSDPRTDPVPVRAVFNALNTPGDAAQQRQALHTAAGEGHFAGLPLEALPAIAELFDIGFKKNETAEQRHARELRYADYLDIAAAVTATDRSRLPIPGEGADKHFDASRCTQLQAEYLRGYLNYRADRLSTYPEAGEQLIDFQYNATPQATALLADIRTELHKIPGLETLRDDRIFASFGRITLNAPGSGITALPQGLHITGGANFKGCHGLTGASHIHAGGDADFEGCGELTGASHIHTGGNANFDYCGKLTGASHIHTGGNAKFRGCGELTGAHHIHTGGYADFEYCDKLTGAHHIHAGEDAYFWDCDKLETAHHIHAGGDADFRGCDALTGASHIHAGRHANFFGCGKLTGAHHIHAGENANFEGCGKLTGASHIHAGEDAKFGGCRALTTASHIHAGGYADFLYCWALKTPGAGCRIHGTLWLTNSGVTGLLDDIYIGKKGLS